ncbi:MAG: tetratricopeptide repeat protein [Nitrospinae bacterium]|nr:tetratricopeptide repeat protein [Nitrospinota bacterium]
MDAQNQSIIEKTGFYFRMGFSVLKKAAEGAIESYKDLVSVEDGAMRDYQLKMGMRHYKNGRYEESVPYLEKVVNSGPKNSDALYRLGVAYSQIEGEEKNAIETLETLSKLDSKNENAWLKLGTLYMEAGDFKKSGDAFMKALEMDPDNFSAHFRLGLFYDRQEKWDAAVKSLQKAIEINPTSVKALHSLGFVHESMGNREEAVKCFKKAIWLPESQEQADGEWTAGKTAALADKGRLHDIQWKISFSTRLWFPSFVALGIADTVSVLPQTSSLLTGLQLAGVAGAAGLIVASIDDLRRSETLDQKMDAGSDLAWGTQGLLYLYSSSAVASTLARGLGIFGAAVQTTIGFLRIRQGLSERDGSLAKLGGLDLGGGFLWLCWDLLGWDQPLFIGGYVLLMIGREVYANRQIFDAWRQRAGKRGQRECGAEES